jgi:FtsP/CotA-like multicopper oxidase with cupredoxin domain
MLVSLKIGAIPKRDGPRLAVISTAHREGQQKPAMPHSSDPSRRTLLAGLSLAAGAGLLFPNGTVRSQEANSATPRLLTARHGEAALQGPDQPARPILGYDGLVPGPALRARRGEPFRLRFANGLDQPTALHWQGLRIEGGAGLPATVREPVAPGGAVDIAFTPRDAGMVLYRPSLLEDGAAQLRHGLAGLLIVDGPAEPVVDRDIALVLADWPAGDATPPPQAGDPQRPAPRITVNGRPDLAIEARVNERLRLRIANTTPARIMQMAVPGQALTLVALDGQPCEPFRLDSGQVTLGPGQRAEVIWDVSGEAGASLALAIANFAGGTLAGSVKLADGAPARPAPLGPPEPLAANPIAQTMDFRRAFRLDLPIEAKSGGETTFNGRSDRTPPRDPAFKVRRGTVVMAGLRNETARFQAVHLEGHPARLLDGLDDGWKPFFLDTVLVAPQSTARIAFLAETPGRWLLTAQAINDDKGPLAAWFEVG